MSEIRVGDTVEWWEPFKACHNKHKPRMLTGVVRSIRPGNKKPWAAIDVEGKRFPGGIWIRDLDKLIVVASEAKNAPAIANSQVGTPAMVGPIEAVVDADEYAQLRAMGDLGGAEL